jgi:hypothetical protein
MGFGIKSIGASLGHLGEEPPAQPPVSFGHAVLAAANGDGVDHAPGTSGPPKLTLDNLAHASLEQLKNADIPALIEEAKQRIGNIDIRGLTLANVDRLPVPDSVKEAIKFLLDPKAYIDNKISELTKKIDDATPPWAKKFLEVAVDIGKGFETVGHAIKSVGGSIKGAFQSAGHAISSLGHGLANAGSAVGSGIVNAGKAALHFFGF